MIPRYRILRERIETELAEVQRAAEKATEAFGQARLNSEHSTYYLDSAALNLHSLYSGTERIFEGVANELDGGLPAGPGWHHDLLTQMTLEVEGVRPAVISPQTARALGEYLRFRHLVRNLYTWSFEEEKLAVLIHKLPQALTDLAKDLAAFGRFLQAASLADEFDEEPE